jgi:hypothetical protein
MTRKALSVLAATLAAWASMASPARAADPGIDRCRIPDSLIRPETLVPRVAEAVADGQPIKIVILGTASSAGAGVSDPRQAYPERLRDELSRRFPRAPVSLVNLAERGWTAAEMAAAIDGKVLPLKPTLVIWQTGTVEAVRGLDVNAMGDALGTGIVKLHAHQVDVVLIVPQYSPRTAAMVNFAPYTEYMERIAGGLEVNLFNRYDIMKHWVEEGFVDFDERGRVLQRFGADQVHGCLAVLLADLIERAARR